MNTRVTMTDVAAAAGVSVMSVSYTYNRPDRVSDETRRRVHAAADSLGYTGPHRAAQSLRSGRTHSLGVVLTEKLTYAFEDPQARRFLSGIAEACLDADTALVILPNSHRDTDIVRIRDAHVDGYVVWTTATDDALLDVLAATGRRTCVQGGPLHPGLELIGVDDRAAADAVATVALRGGRSVGIVALRADNSRESTVVHGADPAAVTMPVTRARLEGYRDACLRAGYDWAGVPTFFSNWNGRSEGAEALRELLADDDVDTVLAMSDELAFGVLDAAAELAVTVPRRLAVSGWDDSPVAEAAGLTTVAQSLFDQGEAAARWVLGLGDLPADTPWAVLERSSTRGAWSPSIPHDAKGAANRT